MLRDTLKMWIMEKGVNHAYIKIKYITWCSFSVCSWAQLCTAVCARHTKIVAWFTISFKCEYSSCLTSVFIFTNKKIIINFGFLVGCHVFWLLVILGYQYVQPTKIFITINQKSLELIFNTPQECREFFLWSLQNTDQLPNVKSHAIGRIEAENLFTA